jgi:hypothetical protein
LVGSGVVTLWFHMTAFNPDQFARRSVAALDAPAVRHEIAIELVDQLGRSANQAAIEFRPAAIIATESLVDTDAFKTIFANAVRTAHSSILAGNDADGLDLSDSLGLIASGLQLADAPADGALTSDGNDQSLSSTVSRIAELPVWNLNETLIDVARVLFGLGLGFAALSLYVAPFRRRAVSRLGVAAAGSGVGIIVILAIASRLAQRLVGDPDLGRAIQDGTWEVTSDLRAFGLSMAVVGLVVAAAASPEIDQRWSAQQVQEAATGWYRRRRATTRGTVVIALATAVAGTVVLFARDTAISVIAVAVGLSMLFWATRLLVSLAAFPAARADSPDTSGRRRVAWVVVAGVAVAATSVLAVANVSISRARADDSYTRTCLGSERNCDLRLDEVTLAGSHNAMSAAESPGWLFAEHTATIGGQLDAGIRGLLIDTHYGRPSSARFPGTDMPLVLTDLAAELAVPGAEVGNPAVRQRAVELTNAAPTDAGGARDVYLCHNYCELGAVRFADELIDLKRFLDENPGDVVMLVIQNAVAAADITSGFEEADLLSKTVVLEPDAPLPTIGELVDAGTQLVVFAERGDDDAPPWLHDAYDWFQETTYQFDSIEDFSCLPNRGDDDNPLFLLNHWVSRSPPEPQVAKEANQADVLAERIAQCERERGVRPTIIAADFSTIGDVISTATTMTGS